MSTHVSIAPSPSYLFIALKSNYAFKPIAGQSLRPNQTIVPQRLNAALGFRSKFSAFLELSLVTCRNLPFLAVGLLTISGCLGHMFPADAMLRVTGEMPVSLGDCSVRMVASPTGEVISKHILSGRFDVGFRYHAAAGARSFEFQLSCNGEVWSPLKAVPLKGRSGVIDLGTIQKPGAET